MCKGYIILSQAIVADSNIADQATKEKQCKCVSDG